MPHHELPFHPLARRWISTLVAGALALGCLHVRPAHAAAPEAGETDAPDSPKEQADALSDQAVEHFNAREFDTAIDLFEQAYALDARANYLFNIGRVYEEKGDLPAAVEYYQRFVGSQSVDLSARQNATERLSVLKKALEAMAEPEPEPEPTSEPTSEPAAGSTVQPPDTGPDRKRTFRIAGYSLLGVGSAALIVGGIFGGLALGKSNDADQEPLVDRTLALRAEATTQARVADAMFITGGVLALTGAVFVLATLGTKSSKTARRAPHRSHTARGATMSPWASHRAAGLSLAGRF